MTATEELRRLLDERGVEWRADDGKTVWVTRWVFDGYSSAMFSEYDDGECVFVTSGHSWTPEQAVAATLGRGTCEVELPGTDYQCNGCGEIVGSTDPTSELYIDGNAIELWRFCPNCGRKVVP